MLAADRERLFLISGNGDVIEPDEGVIAIGSGGVGAQAAATALMRHTQLEALQVAQAAMQIASSLCVFTNHQLTIEELNTDAAS
jgi:ATP-dependent HslUV protease subunit HslV